MTETISECTLLTVHTHSDLVVGGFKIGDEGGGQGILHHHVFIKITINKNIYILRVYEKSFHYLQLPDKPLLRLNSEPPRQQSRSEAGILSVLYILIYSSGNVTGYAGSKDPSLECCLKSTAAPLFN